ncbi:Phosphatidylinositol transfer protein [Trichomonas vaginalis G3]|uniref:Phosphatidylinositol transfer protein n=1 Tax=Trichomonas vaginalis (strain ATCC PRA-98 / G3) TaxID=412133 RepID=A2EKG9_TRIV3|nr:phosphatidylinositol transporter protein [Trichomonas vaginalis G3]EAY06877.1 Phosphatidylinositol transfer protein [Trichomonas vaginalis G3]KAI5489179.1 phosphatidylinositol transporter protein [Trichomonas vaginalis G3]|eukprot:XP_001319100.1 Phosphatidylinositol transfer protein [Trichomonas vaginalis G3]
MKIVEFRIFLPFTMDQTRISSRYAMARRSHEETKGGDGVEVVERKPIEENDNKGFEVHRIYHIKSHAPQWIRWAIPEKYAHVHEINRNPYPHFDVKFNIPDMGNSFILTNESMHIPYKNGDEIPENILNLPDNELKLRRVYYLDLLNGPKSSLDEYDCHGLKFPEAGIDELVGLEGISDDSKPPE